MHRQAPPEPVDPFGGYPRCSDGYRPRKTRHRSACASPAFPKSRSTGWTYPAFPDGPSATMTCTQALSACPLTTAVRRPRRKNDRLDVWHAARQCARRDRRQRPTHSDGLRRAAPACRPVNERLAWECDRADSRQARSTPRPPQSTAYKPVCKRLTCRLAPLPCRSATGAAKRLQFGYRFAPEPAPHGQVQRLHAFMPMRPARFPKQFMTGLARCRAIARWTGLPARAALRLCVAHRIGRERRHAPGQCPVQDAQFCPIAAQRGGSTKIEVMPGRDA